MEGQYRLLDPNDEGGFMLKLIVWGALVIAPLARYSHDSLQER
jgi:hypothetical protein